MSTLHIRIAALAAAALFVAPALAQPTGDPEHPNPRYVERKAKGPSKPKQAQTPQQAGDPESPAASYGEKKAKKGPKKPKKPRTKTPQTPQQSGDPESPGKK